MKVSGPRRAYLIRTIDLFDPSLLQLPLRKHHARVSARRSESWHSAAFAPSSSPAAPRHVALLGTRGPSRPRPPLTVPPAQPAFWNRLVLRYNTITSALFVSCVVSRQLREDDVHLCARQASPRFCTFWVLNALFAAVSFFIVLLPFLSPFFQSFEPLDGLIDTIECEIADLRLCFFN